MTAKAVFLEACAKLREITHIQVLLAIEEDCRGSSQTVVLGILLSVLFP